MGDNFGSLNSYDKQNCKVRPPIVDGIFYPSESDELHKQIELLFKGAPEPERDKAIAIISPHAALDYSGKLAAKAFKASQGRKIETVIVLGPMHRDPIKGFALPTASFFEIPGFTITVNRDYIEKIISASQYAIYDDISHFEEHSIEVQLPFIHFLYPEADIVPILMGSSEEKIIDELSNALYTVFWHNIENTLIVISSNMSSYLTGSDWKKEDETMIALIEKQNWFDITDAIERKTVSACGANCIASFYKLQEYSANSKFTTAILERRNSLQINGDSKKVITYAAIAINID